MRWSLHGFVLISGLALAPLACAQSYPARAVRLIVPFAPGGTVDIVARVLGAKLSQITGHPVFVDNRGGAGGLIGTELAARASADGHTLLVHSSALAYEAALHEKLPYDTLKDLAPISMIGTTPNLLVVGPTFPARSTLELIAMAREKPGGITFATGGVGSASHLAVELFQVVSGARFSHVPYKGAGPALADVVSGQVNFTIATMPGALQHVNAGRLRALAVTGSKRSAALPDVPTVSESGLAGYEYVAWFGAFAPGGTAGTLVARIHALLRETISSSEVREKLESLGVEPQTSPPERFREELKSEIDKWTPIIRRAGIKGTS